MKVRLRTDSHPPENGNRSRLCPCPVLSCPPFLPSFLFCCPSSLLVSFRPFAPLAPSSFLPFVRPFFLLSSLPSFLLFFPSSYLPNRPSIFRFLLSFFRRPPTGLSKKHQYSKNKFSKKHQYSKSKFRRNTSTVKTSSVRNVSTVRTSSVRNISVE